jgi:hypothetical protein
VQAARDLVAAAAELAAGVQVVITTSRADFFICGCMPTGMPRPSSWTVTLESSWMMMSMREQTPASASSTELSTTS